MLAEDAKVMPEPEIVAVGKPGVFIDVQRVKVNIYSIHLINSWYNLYFYFRVFVILFYH